MGRDEFVVAMFLCSLYSRLGSLGKHMASHKACIWRSDGGAKGSGDILPHECGTISVDAHKGEGGGGTGTRMHRIEGMQNGLVVRWEVVRSYWPGACLQRSRSRSTRE